MRRHPTALALLPAAMLLAGCGPRVSTAIDAGPGWSDPIVPVDFNPNIDILFVIDNSGSMAEEQASLAANFPRFINVLEAIEGGLPNVNLGVISTNVGAGPYPISGCVWPGDNGALQSTRGEGAPPYCIVPTGAFIQDWDDGAGGRLRNYDSYQGLAASFACIAQLGTSGCGFEQPLESMRRALDGSVAGNAGFMRPDAFLAVIFITDEDDCSTRDDSMFDTSSMTLSDPLGPLSSFRCFEYGVDCAIGNDDRRAPGPRMNCSPRADSPYMFHPDEYIDFLKNLKPDPGQVIVAGIIGDETPVVVASEPELAGLHLAPSCATAAGEAAPGVRMSHFIRAFPQRNTITTICNEDLSDALVLIATILADAIGNPCVIGDIDIDPDLAGVQYQCQVTELWHAGQEDQIETVLPECDAGASNATCWRFVEDLALCTGGEHPSHLKLEIVRGSDIPRPGTTYSILCQPGS